MRVLSLFSGIGGFELACEMAGMTVVGQVEIDPYCRKVLEKHWTGVKRLENIFDVRGDEFGPVDLIVAGVPCQPASCAGKRRGTEDDRWLWGEALRIVKSISPAWCLFENPTGILSLQGGVPFENIIVGLEDEGYEVQPLIIPASGVGAPHRRERVFIVAYSEGLSERPGLCQGEQAEQRRRRSGYSGSEDDVADTEGVYAQGFRNGQGQGQFGGGRWWAVEPDVGRGFNGIPSWLERHIGRGMSYAESRRSVEVLRELWNPIISKTLWGAIGGFDRLQKAEILFSLVREYQKSPDEARLLMESEEALKGFVRGLWMQGALTGSPCRQRQKEQRAEEHSDALQVLSRLLAHNSQENWQISCWEDGIPRVSRGIESRVDRLKALGNSIVPQVAYPILKAIAEIEAHSQT